MKFWQAIYESAKKQQKTTMHIWNFMQVIWEPDIMRLIIWRSVLHAGVDGIILEFNGEEALKKEIDKAETAGIPVITIMNDAPDSKRQSFVGVNDYQMGQAYGEQVAALMDENTETALILLDSEKGDFEKSQIYSQISNVVMEQENGENVKIQAQNLMPENKFDIEEAIRTIFQSPEGPPQILVCMDEVTTECAYQAMIDFNMVGEVKIIGYYVSDTIREAVNKGLIPVTCTLDTEKVGKDCIEALWEYKQEGRVNSYYNVELEFVSKNEIPKAIAADTMEEQN